MTIQQLIAAIEIRIDREVTHQRYEGMDRDFLSTQIDGKYNSMSVEKHDLTPTLSSFEGMGVVDRFVSVL
jgi:hypothetical protein